MKAVKAFFTIKALAVVAVVAAVGFMTINEARADEPTNITVIGGGWSQHHGLDIPGLNESHNAIGLMYNDDWTITTFKNSFGGQSTMAGYNWNMYEVTAGDFDFSANIITGLIYGYEDGQGGLQLTGPIDLYVLPNLSARYWLTQDIAIGAEFGIAPLLVDGAVLTTQTISVTFKF